MLFMDFKIEKLIKNRISSSYDTIQKLIENCCLDISNSTDIIKTSFTPIFPGVTFSKLTIDARKL